MKNPHGAHVFFSAEIPQRSSLGSQGGQPGKRGVAGLGPWEGGVAGNRQWKKGYSVRLEQNSSEKSQILIFVQDLSTLSFFHCLFPVTPPSHGSSPAIPLFPGWPPWLPKEFLWGISLEKTHGPHEHFQSQARTNEKKKKHMGPTRIVKPILAES